MVTRNLTMVNHGHIYFGRGHHQLFDGPPWTTMVDHQITMMTMVDHGHHFAWIIDSISISKCEQFLSLQGCFFRRPQIPLSSQVPTNGQVTSHGLGLWRPVRESTHVQYNDVTWQDNFGLNFLDWSSNKWLLFNDTCKIKGKVSKWPADGCEKIRQRRAELGGKAVMKMHVKMKVTTSPRWWSGHVGSEWGDMDRYRGQGEQKRLEQDEGEW